ncbi:hypothetical protein [Amycolatopsis sp. cg13]|uniref:hypothetical protein n=1 Tax=Amycolatopsis sp. cg13 TaxID=3238807 RepID=UPI003523160E
MTAGPGMTTKTTDKAAKARIDDMDALPPRLADSGPRRERASSRRCAPGSVARG